MSDRLANIIRFPNLPNMMRGPNMARKLCSACLIEKTHGFWIFDENVMSQAIFICDDCLTAAKRTTRTRGETKKGKK